MRCTGYWRYEWRYVIRSSSILTWKMEECCIRGIFSEIRRSLICLYLPASYSFFFSICRLYWFFLFPAYNVAFSSSPFLSFSLPISFREIILFRSFFYIDSFFAALVTHVSLVYSVFKYRMRFVFLSLFLFSFSISFSLPLFLSLSLSLFFFLMYRHACIRPPLLLLLLSLPRMKKWAWEL